mmetsp:Transcript_70057/g.138746  ORF Transcript_70057/g.138746 Transcript_70057/m.138746 type:complete len:82 (-) Transcript_70057:365-610(-)
MSVQCCKVQGGVTLPGAVSGEEQQLRVWNNIQQAADGIRITNACHVSQDASESLHKFRSAFWISKDRLPARCKRTEESTTT